MHVELGVRDLVRLYEVMYTQGMLRCGWISRAEATSVSYSKNSSTFNVGACALLPPLIPHINEILPSRCSDRKVKLSLKYSNKTCNTNKSIADELEAEL